MQTFEFKVESWGESGDDKPELMAGADNMLVAKGAFEAAVKLRPRVVWTLRHGARVVQRHVPGD